VILDQNTEENENDVRYNFEDTQLA